MFVKDENLFSTVEKEIILSRDDIGKRDINSDEFINVKKRNKYLIEINLKNYKIYKKEKLKARINKNSRKRETNRFWKFSKM